MKDHMTRTKLIQAIRHGATIALLLASGASAFAHSSSDFSGKLTGLVVNQAPGYQPHVGETVTLKLSAVPKGNTWALCTYKMSLRSSAGGFDYASDVNTIGGNSYGGTPAEGIISVKPPAVGTWVVSVTGNAPLTNNPDRGGNACEGQVSATFVVAKADLNLDTTQAASGGVIGTATVTPYTSHPGDQLTLKVNVAPSNIGVNCRLRWTILRPSDLMVIGGKIEEVKGDQSGAVVSRTFNTPSVGFGLGKYEIKVRGEPQGNSGIPACTGGAGAGFESEETKVTLQVPTFSMPACPSPYAVAAVQLYGTGSITCEL